MTFHLRVARPDDAADLVAIYGPVCTGSIATFETEVPGADAMAERVRSTVPTHPWVVAVDDDRVVGYAYASRLRDRPAYRWSVETTVYVGAGAAGRGVGTVLYGQLLRLLSAQHFHRAHAAIALPNDPSVALHRRHGFAPVGTFLRVGHKLGAWRDVQWWSRVLADPGSPPVEPTPFADLDPIAMSCAAPTGLHLRT